MHYRAVLPVYADHAGIKYLNLYSILVFVLQCRITGCVGINGALSYSFVLQQRAVQPYCTLLRSHALQCAASDSRGSTLCSLHLTYGVSCSSGSPLWVGELRKEGGWFMCSSSAWNRKSCWDPWRGQKGRRRAEGGTGSDAECDRKQ